MAQLGEVGLVCETRFGGVGRTSTKDGQKEGAPLTLSRQTRNVMNGDIG